MGDEPGSPRAEFLMAAAGPFSSFILAVLFWSIWFSSSIFEFPLVFTAPFYALSWINVSLAIFNLVPGYPLDGGRILRSILWFFLDDIVKSTRIASLFGQGYAYILILIGIWAFFFQEDPSAIWLVLIGLFLNFIARSSYKQVLYKSALEKISVSELVNPNIATVSPDITLSEFLNNYLYSYDYNDYPVVEGDILIGKIRKSDIEKRKPEEMVSTMVKQLVQPLSFDEIIEAKAKAIEALRKMAEKNKNYLFVVEDHKISGIITKSDIVELLSVRIEKKNN